MLAKVTSIADLARLELTSAELADLKQVHRFCASAPNLRAEVLVAADEGVFGWKRPGDGKPV
jgi:hypothetical protein